METRVSMAGPRHHHAMPIAASVWDLRRNDLEGALAFIRAHKVTADELRTLMLLQDDSGDQLMDKVRELGLEGQLSPAS